MKKKHWLLGAGACVVAASAAVAIGIATAAPARTSSVLYPQRPIHGGVMVRPRGNFSKSEVRHFPARGLAFTSARRTGESAFPLYSVGPYFRNLPMTAIVRIDEPPLPGEKVRGNNVNFMYGQCESIDGAGCAVPLVVQVWNACERNEQSYIGPSGPSIIPDEQLIIRGVRASFFERGTRLEIYTRKSTIVLFTDRSERQFLLDAAKSLRGENVTLAPGAPFLSSPAEAAPSTC